MVITVLRCLLLVLIAAFFIGYTCFPYQYGRHTRAAVERSSAKELVTMLSAAIADYQTQQQVAPKSFTDFVAFDENEPKSPKLIALGRWPDCSAGNRVFNCHFKMWTVTYKWNGDRIEAIAKATPINFVETDWAVSMPITVPNKEQ